MQRNYRVKIIVFMGIQNMAFLDDEGSNPLCVLREFCEEPLTVIQVSRMGRPSSYFGVNHFFLQELDKLEMKAAALRADNVEIAFHYTFSGAYGYRVKGSFPDEAAREEIVTLCSDIIDRFDSATSETNICKLIHD